MSRTRNHSRFIIIVIVLLALAAFLTWSFWPSPEPVDFGKVERGSLVVTINEEARTRVHDVYVVSAPIAGHLLRVEVEVGDEVVGGETLVARMEASRPPAIDIRTRQQAEAAVRSAEAALRVARAELGRVEADRAFAETELARVQRIAAQGAASQADLERAERAMRTADAAMDTARAGISARQADLAQTRAQLIEFLEPGDAMAETRIPITAPVSGQVLRLLQESEAPVMAGQPILEIGDVPADLEVVAELLSTDAVQIEAGDRVIIDNWGGKNPLNGQVIRIEPFGFTKTSALGVEEQRVNVVIGFSDPIESYASLGHGYRVEVQIVAWEAEDTLVLPSSALFRVQDDWAVFIADDGTARRQIVEIDQNNGEFAAIKAGVSAGQDVILYPGPTIEDGIRVEARSAG
tara:strand:+ start:2576 stop:3796 length:1221 start_codon:yes stop_codon:yes gene_type:complete